MCDFVDVRICDSANVEGTINPMARRYAVAGIGGFPQCNTSTPLSVTFAGGCGHVLWVLFDIIIYECVRMFPA
ncbi:MAG: hypothetical protein A2W93_05950 [Bacteroidetes bacterium GWF2_43_63]|nr:MAG: hypothetical protein A2W94_04445 [Bacteroidetes bacterium GWE2_42_42]OFY55961.1 MAG: hypothetical protein A2W93_05950 [Bacteroidetes bacterium GWF2_43_63]